MNTQSLSMHKQYSTVTAFRMALEERLKNLSKQQGLDLQRLRRQVAFDRLLCRLFKAHPNEFVLKGGYAMELRLEKARTTKDIDLILESKMLDKQKNQDQEIHAILLEAVHYNLNDFFVFIVRPSTLELEAIPYGGFRFPVEAHLDGRLFERFPLDVVVSSLILDPIETISSQNFLAFAGISTTQFPAISKEQQFAEKLHAYTLPRKDDENSRVKDMVDLILLIESGFLKMNLLSIALKKIFEYRGTHSLPKELQPPPKNWELKFDKLAKECTLEISLDNAFNELQNFLRKIS